MGYIMVITHLLTIDPNFLGHPSGGLGWVGAGVLTLLIILLYISSLYCIPKTKPAVSAGKM